MENFVYITDYCKLWFDGFKNNSNDLNDINIEILQNEIKAIQPNIIITFGNAYTHLLEDKFQISKRKVPQDGDKYIIDDKSFKVLTLIHPSKMVKPKDRMSFFEVNEVDVNLTDIEQYNCLINKILEGENDKLFDNSQTTSQITGHS